MNKIRRTIFLIVSTLILCLGTSSVYAAEPSLWAVEEVTKAIEEGLVPEDMQQNYQNGITRLDYCRLTIRLLESYTSKAIEVLLSERNLTINAHAFSDTSDTSVLAANALGIVQGVGNGLFAPTRGINRAEAAAMLMRTANLLDDYTGFPYVYDDARLIPAWAREAVYAARETGIMTGTDMNEFQPSAPYTREAAIMTVGRMYQTLQGQGDALPNLFPMSVNVDGMRLWGYVDKSGQFVIAPKYIYASEWNRGYGIVSLPEEPHMCFVIDSTGERMENGHRFAGDYPFINSDPPSVRFYGDYLHVLYGGRDSEIKSFSEGMLGIWFQDYQSYYDRNGAEFGVGYWGGAFYDGVAVTHGPPDFLYHLRNKRGEIVYTNDLGKRSDIIISGSEGQVGNLIVTMKAGKEGGPDNWQDKNGNWRSMRGVIQIDGKTVMEPEYDYIKITPFKQILASKTGEPYTLYAADGKTVVHKFPGYITGALHTNGIGHYLYRASSTEAVVFSTAGDVSAKIALAPDAKIEFISGLVSVVDSAGSRYFDVSGQLVLEARE